MVPSSISIHVVEGAPNNSCRQCLCPQGEPPPASLGGSPRPAGRSGPGSCQITAFALGPGVCEILCEPFKSKVSISPNPLGLLKLSLTGLQSQMLWGFILTWGSVLSRLWENLCNAIILQFVGHSPRAMGLDYVMGLFFVLILSWFLLYVFSCRTLCVLVGSSLFHQWLFCR